VRVVADANVLLSAVLGGRARVVLYHPRIDEVLTTAVTLAEVQEYAAHLAKRKRLALDLVLLTVAALPVTVVEAEAYSAAVSEAQRRISWRDPDDVEILALALHLSLPVWSNDNDFRDADVEWCTTAGLLRALGR
jgi:predicted nucleic acid-binding protein